jgi:sensor histidine kinase regulating citrate/malate metabolism
MSATPFAARLAAVIIAVVLAASALTVSLDYLKFRRVLRNQEDLVYLFVAHDLAGAIEDSMNLGLPLAALQTTEQMIERRRMAERGTLGITVYDSKGMVLFDTDRYRVGSQLPGSWAGGPGAAEWRSDQPGAYLVGVPIINNFDQFAGGVIVRYDPVALEARMNAILLDMTRAALLMLAVTAAVAIAASILLTRRHRIWFQRASAQLASLAPGAPPYRDAPIPGSEAIMASAERTAQMLDEAEATLMRLGTGEVEQARAA